MASREISHDSWLEFFQSFTRDHAGWPTTVTISEKHTLKKSTSDEEVHALPLRDIAADLKDKESTIVITVGSKDDELLTHEVRKVSHVRHDNGDSAQTLILESDGGQTTTLTLSALKK